MAGQLQRRVSRRHRSPQRPQPPALGCGRHPRLGGSPLLPVRAGELQCRSLGAKVEAFDEQGNSLIDEVGELVLTRPMPSMPLYFWNDPDGKKYLNSYFDTYPGVWRHG